MSDSDYVLSGGGLAESKFLKDGGYEEWDSEQLADYLAEAGLGDYKANIIDHKVTGKIAPLLSDQDLRDMGITVVGDRLRFKQNLLSLGRKARFQGRIKAIWHGEEKVFFGNAEKELLTCFGLCPHDPSTYTLTSNHIKIKSVKPTRCGPLKMCCCPYEYSVNNLDLTTVNDVDVVHMPAPGLQRVCCCAKGKDMVEIERSNISITDQDGGGSKVMLVLKAGDGERVSELILNQVEESQRMERN